MRRHLPRVVAIMALASSPAVAACPPELLAKMIDQGYDRAEVLRLCGDGGGAAAPSGRAVPQSGRAEDPRVEEAFGRLRALTGRLTAQCGSTGGRNARSTGPCDLADQYGEILGLWQGARAKCRGGDGEACRILGTAAEQFLNGEPAPPGPPRG